MVLVVALAALLPVSMAIASEQRIPMVAPWLVLVVTTVALLLAVSRDHSDAHGTLETIAILYACLLAGAVWIGAAMRNHARPRTPGKR